MSSILLSDTPSEAPLQSELEGYMVRAVDGFYAKFFEDKPYSTAIRNKIQVEKLTEGVGKLSTDILGLGHYDELVNWLATFQALFFAADQASFRLISQLLTKPGFPLKASIRLETSDSPAVAGSTRVFGEYHSASAGAAADDHGDILRFCEGALQVFKAQPARCFLHGFLIRGTTLELWVFDRSGAYSSEKLNLAGRPDLLVQTLASYTMMSDEDVGFNTFVKRLGSGSDSCVTFDQHNKLHLRTKLIAAPGYLVGLGTTCCAASASTTGQPDVAVKFSWRQESAHAELRQLNRARECNVWGVIQLVGDQELASIADFRQGLQFSQPFINRTLSCVATAPLGRPIQKWTSIPELLEVLRDLVKALRSLYLDAGIIHRDIAIKNLIIALQPSADSPKGVLIDFDQALELKHARAIEPLVGSDGFMAIGILSGQKHTYRHDLESLFYVFLWLAIGNDHEHDDANDILNGIPKTSRLWTWCSLDFRTVGREKATDMSPEGFSRILGEFSADFAPLRGLAEELHALMFPLRDGKIFTGTETEEAAVKQLYNEMAGAFDRAALALKK
ncbi:kinase-like domain-containing protein [Xylaria cf. heliscus]|nr:kinase-like domain-containing protein [Xylaria cf. heliscus]